MELEQLMDEYGTQVIGDGAVGSEYLQARTNETLANQKGLLSVITEGKGGAVAINVPDGYYVAVHGVGGDPNKKDVGDHAASMIEKLADQAERIGAIPVALADIVDANKAEMGMLEKIADGLVSAANKKKVAIINGELAVLGHRINWEYGANVSGIMVSLISKENIEGELGDGDYERGGARFSVFDPGKEKVVINVDGIGTKTDFYERVKKYARGVYDFLAMNLDDCIKIAATARAVVGVLETKGRIPVDSIEAEYQKAIDELGIQGFIEHVEVGDRIKAYHHLAASYNLSGGVVSTVDEERLRNPLTPKAGDHLLGIRKTANIRSNGITNRRKIMEALFGWAYHKNPEAKEALDYVTRPSTILYKAFKTLIDKDLATGVYHNSGGAWEEKVAQPIAKQGLYARIKEMFKPDPAEKIFMEATCAPNEKLYGQWPMGTDGVVATGDWKAAKKILEGMGYEVMYMGKLEEAKIGLELNVRNSSGDNVKYSGIPGIDLN